MTQTRCPHCGSIYDLSDQAEAFPDDLGWSAWWAKYPRKVGKLAAMKLYRATVLRQLATPAELLIGLKRYCAYKPEEQPWCHPKTWLSEGRWDDEEPEAAWENRHQKQGGFPLDKAEAPRMPLQATQKPVEVISPERRAEMQEKIAGLAAKLKAG